MPARSAAALFLGVLARAALGADEKPVPLSLRLWYTGTMSGSMALLYPYPTLHRPDCILAMAIQGSAMRGTMPACGTQRMDAVMQRVTR